MLRSTSAPLLDWLGNPGATKVAIHFDVDTIDADEIQLGLGADRGGLEAATGVIGRLRELGLHATAPSLLNG